MPSQSSGDRLPFEPRQNKKKTPKKTPNKPIKSSSKTKSSNKAKSSEASLSAIPEAVSKRMIKRMALFSGIPTALGISSFIISYVIVTQEWFKLPNVVPLLVSMGCFGLGVIGLSYGILSSSWDEERNGSWWGWEEFTINFGRMKEAWRSTKKEAKTE